ncbi:SET domain-containing protein [Mycena indigotica]|uniref:SET domain-containing protein n=1 Tax=Mycena indigotica TaxID=2126181 RepID=A0A8H6WHN9_9AGAR|nr:SET domain-containing protein [Mycena indigotica]KAF7315288.1 SET domain-containing protein [Mycena indigotica]
MCCRGGGQSHINSLEHLGTNTCHPGMCLFTGGTASYRDGNSNKTAPRQRMHGWRQIYCTRGWPVAIVPSNIDPSLSWKREAFDGLIPRIIPSERECLLELANCHSVELWPVVEGIALTNAFGVELGVTEQEYGGIFPHVSCANHCCGLNTAIKWDPATFSVSMYSLRDVQAGEEIHNQYIDVLALAPNDGPSSPNTTFDAARAELRDWRNTHTQDSSLGQRDMCRSDDVVIESSLRALELVRQEGLWGMQVPFMEDLALSYAVLGDEERFRVWAEKEMGMADETEETT